MIFQNKSMKYGILIYLNVELCANCHFFSCNKYSQPILEKLHTKNVIISVKGKGNLRSKGTVGYPMTPPFMEGFQKATALVAHRLRRWSLQLGLLMELSGWNPYTIIV